jgi:imidazolonepropionase-like amidohydrolase
VTCLAFTNARLVDCTGGEPQEGVTLVTDEERIVDIGTGGAPASADQVVDCGGRTVMPGLIDAHVHIGAIDVDIMEQHRNYATSHAALKMGRILGETLLQGFTTVRDAGGCDAGFRQAIEDGTIPGPRLLVSNRPLSQTGGHADFRRPTESGDPLACCSKVGMRSAVADGPDEVRRVTRENLRTGANQIKIMASGGAMSPADELDTTQYTVPELRAAVEEAAAVGTYVLAHAYSGAAIRNCIEAGVRCIEHGNLIDEETAKAMAAADMYLVPTLSTYELLYRRGADYGIPRRNIEKIGVAHERALEGLSIAHAAGVRIASGSDLLGPLAAYKHRELELKAEVLSPLEVLVATTRTNAELMGLADDLGTLQVGKLADLVVIDGDPLTNVSVLGRPEGIPVILQGGRLVKNAL